MRKGKKEEKRREEGLVMEGQDERCFMATSPWIGRNMTDKNELTGRHVFYSFRHRLVSLLAAFPSVDV